MNGVQFLIFHILNKTLWQQKQFMHSLSDSCLSLFDLILSRIEARMPLPDALQEI